MLIPTRNIQIITSEIRIIKSQAEQILFTSAVEIGRRLVEAKEQMEHGLWGAYLKDELELSQSTANNLMRVFREYGTEQMALEVEDGVRPEFQRLTYSKALALLAVPEEERPDFVKEHDGTDVSTRDFQKEVERYKTECSELKMDIDDLEEKISKTEKSNAEYLAEMNTLQQAQSEAETERQEAVAKLLEMEATVPKAMDITAERERIRADLESEYERRLAETETANFDIEAEREKLRRELEVKLEKENYPAFDIEAEREKLRSEMTAKTSEEQILAENRVAELERKLASSQNPSLTQMNFLFKDFQDNFNRLLVSYRKLGIEQPELQEKLAVAFGKTLQFMQEQIGGTNE